MKLFIIAIILAADHFVMATANITLAFDGNIIDKNDQLIPGDKNNKKSWIKRSKYSTQYQIFIIRIDFVIYITVLMAPKT